MRKDISKEIEKIVIQNDLNLIERERITDIRTIKVTDLVKDLTKLYKEKNNG